MCCLSADLWTVLYSHLSHLYGLSPVCEWMCLRVRAGQWSGFAMWSDLPDYGIRSVGVIRTALPFAEIEVLAVNQTFVYILRHFFDAILFGIHGIRLADSHLS